MYKDFVNVTPESGGAGTTSIAVAADENEGAARSTSLNIAGGGVTRTVSITQKKMLVENQIEVKYWLDAATSEAGKSIYLEAYANNDVASNLKINFSIDQQGPTGEWETNTPVEILEMTLPQLMKFHIMITDGVFMKKWLLLPLLKMKILFMILQDSLKNLGLQKLVSGK